MPVERVAATVMYARFKKWCADNGEQPISIKEFKGRLIELDVTPGRSNKERFWKDVKLIK